MLAGFFQLFPIASDQLHGQYDLRLVILSWLVAVFASYIALDLVGRLRDTSNTKADILFWLVGGSIAMGAGIWSMHFIGMLSFTIPGLTLRYDLFWTGFSLLVAVLVSGFALYLLKAATLNLMHLLVGGVILGLGIASMHYTGMGGMLITLNIRYLPNLFFVSILIAIFASEAAIWLALKSNQIILKMRNRIKLISAVIMGVAICGMHYTGMAAAIFTPLCGGVPGVGALDPTVLSMSVAAITFVILGVAYFASAYKEASNQQKLETARQLGMAEVAASVLHNVGNVLNSLNVSTNILSEKVNQSKMQSLNDLRTLMHEHKDNLGDFIAKDAQGSQIPRFLDKLTDHWNEEQQAMSGELGMLTKNIAHIKDIISTQQGFRGVKSMEHVIQINDILQEALLITGLDISREIRVEKDYAHLKPILIDKVKMLQIIINLLANAKEAVRASSKPDKLIMIKTSLNDSKTISIEVRDNGVGITPEHVKKIFSYGFTTKQTGHGFGLHMCALSANEMGGSLRVKSDGVEKGATFIFEVPYRIPAKL